MPFTNKINPVINEGVYIALRGIVHYKLDRLDITVSVRKLTPLFVVYATDYFTMQVIADCLGVSIKYLYRMIANETDTGKSGRVSMLVLHLLKSSDYADFIEKCRRIHIIVKKE